ncbi:MAG: acyltransferase family protein [Ruminococcus sp.]
MGNTLLNKSGKRMQWLDIAKGIGIILVILGHAPRDIMRQQFFGIDFGYQFIYAFHMQLFFIVSGYLFCISVNKYSPGKFLKKRVQSLLMPWLVYTLLIYVIRYAAEFVPKLAQILSTGDFHMMSFWDYMLLAVECNNPYSFHLWFIFVAFLVQIICFAMFRLLNLIFKNEKTSFVWIIILVLSIAGYFASRFGTVMVIKLLGLQMFSFVLGACMGVFNLDRLLEKNSVSIVISGFGIVAVTLYAWFYRQIAASDYVHIFSSVLQLIGAPCMSFFVLFVSKKIQNNGFGRVLAWTGQNSFTIYLLHQPLCCALVGTVLLSVLSNTLVSYIAVMSVCAVLSFILPIFVVWLLDKIHLGFILKPLNIQKVNFRNTSDK